MSRIGPCLCGDTECPSCGPLQGSCPEPPEATAEVEGWLDNLDAAMFSGDSFLNPRNAERLRWYMERWTRELDLNAKLDDEPSDNMTDVEADADTLASAGMGTDEDYGFFGDNDGH